MQFRQNKKNVGKMEVVNQTEASADLNIFGDIVSDDWGKWSDDDTCPSDISEFLKNLEGVQELNLHINSGGGSVFGGIAIYNMLKRHSAKITTYIDGIAASIASVIACVGDRIIIPENATFMMHKPSNGYLWTNMNADDLRKDADILDICQKSILQTYMTKAKDGITEDQITKMINDETWLVGADASEYFDFDVENEVQAVACASEYFSNYKNTPEPFKKTDPIATADEIAEAVVKKMKAAQGEERKSEANKLTDDLYLYGV